MLPEPDPLAGPWSLRCETCGRTAPVTLADVAKYGRASWMGWPVCCGETMPLYVKSERLGLADEFVPAVHRQCSAF